MKTLSLFSVAPVHFWGKNDLKFLKSELNESFNIMKTLLSLPPELLEALCHYLDPIDLSRLGQSCKMMRDITSTEAIWRDLILHKYQLNPEQYSPWTSRTFYQNMLHPYGAFLGVWQMSFGDYGGLLRVFVEEGSIVGEETYSHPLEDGMYQPLSQKKVFRVHMEEKNAGSSGKEVNNTKIEVHFVCLIGADESPSFGCESAEPMVLFHDRNQDLLQIRCTAFDLHDQRMGRLSENYMHNDWKRSHDRWIETWFMCSCSRIKMDPFIPQVPPFTLSLPQPGVFVGDYGPHGTELVQVRYKQVERSGPNTKQNLVEAHKITGDPNIPKQKVTFRAFLDQPVYPSDEQQRSMQELSAIESVPPSSTLVEPPQRFNLPDHINCDFDKNLIPSFSYGRFKAEIQLAGHNYYRPAFSSSQLVIFNQHLLGLFIFEFDELMIFERVNVDC